MSCKHEHRVKLSLFAAIPDIEDNVPLPASATDALPELPPHEELQMRARTITFLKEIQGDTLATTPEARNEAEQLAKKMIEDPHFRPDYAKYGDSVTAYLAGMVAQYNTMIVEELADLKLYVVNKLVKEIEEAPNGKIRVSALKLLGEVDGVDAFKRRTEVEHKFVPIQQVETELLGLLENVEYRVIGRDEGDERGERDDFSDFAPSSDPVLEAFLPENDENPGENT